MRCYNDILIILYEGDALLQQLAGVVGDQHVRTDEAACVLFAQDVYTKSNPALAVVSPANTEELANVVRAVTDAGHAVIARGGGMSYTSGYVPRATMAASSSTPSA